MPAGYDLRGKQILLFARVPEIDQNPEVDLSEDGVRELEEVAITVEQAIVSLGRAVFSAKGRLVFAHHPFVSGLLAQVALEYWEPPELESGQVPRPELYKPVTIFPSQFHISEEEKSGLDPIGVVSFASERPDDLAAAILIGGDNDDQRHFRALSEQRMDGMSFYVIGSTGGAASGLSETMRDQGEFDRKLWFELSHSLERLRVEAHSEGANAEETIPEFRYASYPLLMHRIVTDIAERSM
jgi:hypothetical protein